MPRTGEIDKIGILGTDASDLMETINFNMSNQEKGSRFQRKVSYDNLPVEAMDELRQLTAALAQELLELLNRRIAEHDRDVNPEAGGTGRLRAGVGVYYFEENVGEVRGEEFEEVENES